MLKIRSNIAEEAMLDQVESGGVSSQKVVAP
jgi:hypothetical protein